VLGANVVVMQFFSKFKSSQQKKKRIFPTHLAPLPEAGIAVLIYKHTTSYKICK